MQQKTTKLKYVGVGFQAARDVQVCWSVSFSNNHGTEK